MIMTLGWLCTYFSTIDKEVMPSMIYVSSPDMLR